MTPGDRELYEKLANALMKLVPKDWKSAWIDAEIGEDWGTNKIYCLTSAGATIRLDPGFDLFDEIDQVFVQLSSMMQAAGQPHWHKAHFALQPDGQFRMNFDYAG